MISAKFTDNKLLKNNENTIEIKTFKELKIKESQIESFVEECIGDIFEDEEESLIIIGKQTINKGSYRSDLIAIDVESGDLILIEIKRDVNDIKGRGETFVAQAIKYASSLATINSLEELVGLYAKYLDKTNINGNETSLDKARKIIYREFTETEINNNQRIVLIASDFDDITMASATWLSEKGINIKLIKLIPTIINDQLFIKKEVVLRNKELPYIPFEDYKLKTNNVSSKSQKISYPRMAKLFEWKIIKKGDKVYIKRENVNLDSEAIVVNENIVKFKGDNMTFNAWGQKITGWSSIQIYKYVVVNDSQETLHELRINKLDQIKNPDN